MAVDKEALICLSRVYSYYFNCNFPLLYVYPALTRYLTIIFLNMLLLSFAFHDLKFCPSSQLKAASCALCRSEMPPSKQVNGHSFTTCLIVWGSPQSQSGEAM